MSERAKKKNVRDWFTNIHTHPFDSHIHSMKYTRCNYCNNNSTKRCRTRVLDFNMTAKKIFNFPHAFLHSFCCCSNCVDPYFYGIFSRRNYVSYASFSSMPQNFNFLTPRLFCVCPHLVVILFLLFYYTKMHGMHTMDRFSFKIISLITWYVKHEEEWNKLKKNGCHQSFLFGIVTVFLVFDCGIFHCDLFDV